MANSPHLIGMHYTGPTLRAALVKDDGEILEKREIEISPDTMMEQVAGLAKDLASKSGRVSAVGFGIPGLVNRQTDVCHYFTKAAIDYSGRSSRGTY
jgi:predicted NBD/HSP70 family sugar kinase